MPHLLPLRFPGRLYLVLLLVPVLLAAPLEARVWPTGVTEYWPIYFVNDSANPATGLKPNWETAFSTKDTPAGMWQSQEHALLQAGPDRILIVNMESNRNYLYLPDNIFVEAFAFLEYDTGLFNGVATTPDVELGYWRGDTINAHRSVWAPHVLQHEGTFYMFYSAPDPGSGLNACYLATSATGNADPAAWQQYDPVPATPEVEPLFAGENGIDIRDFYVIPVDTGSGTQFRNYYQATLFDEDLGWFVIETRVRLSDNLTVWPLSSLQSEAAFRRVNVGVTRPDRYLVDYENPAVIPYGGDYYLLISRHGLIPADEPTNPDWKAIPHSVEVYWSPDGLVFDQADQGPDLTTPSGLRINAAEVISFNGKWYATHYAHSNDLANWPYDVGGNPPTEHSEVLIKGVQISTQAEDSIHLFEFQWLEEAGIPDWPVLD